MKQFVNTLQSELDSHLQVIRLDTEENIKAAELSIEVLLPIIEKLKQFIIKHKFKNKDEEINFFKHIKPQFISKLIYHNRLLSIEMKKPYGGEKVTRQYLNNELDKLKRFFDNNLEFYKYYRTNSSYLDHKFFVRGKHDIKLGLDTFYFEADHRFTTSHDYKVAKIIAHDLIQVYLETELSNLDRSVDKQNNNDTPSRKLTWTDTKTSLIELIYALHSQEVFNNGNTGIKEIAKYFELAFNIDLGDYYRSYLELRLRKKDRTKFLQTLNEKLKKRMDLHEEKD